jgi:predicted metal-binding membrane protein
MDNLQKTLIISLISVSAASWIVARAFQADMMSAMMAPLNPLAVSLFVAVWTAGMAAMMFPAISPVVLLYNRLIRNEGAASVALVEERDSGRYPVKMALFIGSYLAVWSTTGLVLLLAWSVSVSAVIASVGSPILLGVFGSILIIAGAYQFSPLKAKCLGYCESPMSFFMRRWRKGTAGALRMGTYHGLYCLGCCWPYFLVMVALGWMDIAWMGLFAGVIFGEKIWSKGIWVARAAGIGLVLAGILAIAGVLPLAPDAGMAMSDESQMSQMPAVMDAPPAENMPEEPTVPESDMKMDSGSPGMKM